jgi:hypothetical protein
MRLQSGTSTAWFCLAVALVAGPSSPTVCDAGPLRVGDIVVVQQNSGRISVVDPDSGHSVTAFEMNHTFGGLSHAVLDPQGRLLTATRDTYGILRMDFASGMHEPLVAGGPIVRPSTLAIDQSGRILIGDTDGWLIRADLQLGTKERLTRYISYSNIRDIEVGRDGTIYILDFGIINSGGGKLVALDPVTFDQTVITQGNHLFNASDMAIEPSGNILVHTSRFNSSKVVRVDVESGSQELLLTHDDEGFMTLDADGSVLIGLFNARTILRGNLATGELTPVAHIAGWGAITGIDVYIPEPNAIAILASSVACMATTFRIRLRRRNLPG